MDFEYSLSGLGLRFKAHSEVKPVGEGYVRTALSYTADRPLPCRDIVFIGFNPASAGVPKGTTSNGTEQTQPKPVDPTVKDLLTTLAREDQGDFQTVNLREVTVTFCNLFAFARPTLKDKGKSTTNLYAQEASRAAREVLKSNGDALVICGWGRRGYMNSKSDEWKQQLSVLIPILADRRCYRIEKDGDTCSPCEARSWSRRGLGAAGLKPVTSLSELKQFVPQVPAR